MNYLQDKKSQLGILGEMKYKEGSIVILAITNTNEKLIREISAKNGYDDIEVHTGIKDLQDFSIR